MVAICRFFAVVLIAGAIAGVCSRWSPFNLIDIERQGERHVIVSLPPGSKNVHVGDVVDLRGTSVAERYRLSTETLRGEFDIPIVRGSKTEREVFIPDPDPRTPLSILGFFRLALILVTGGAGAVVLWRRPGVLALLFGLFCAQSIPTLPIIAELTLLPDAVLNVASPIWFALTNDIGLFALLPFVMRFPTIPRSAAGFAVMRAADATLVLASILFIIRDALIFPNDFADPWWVNVVPALLSLVALIAMTSIRFARSSGSDRRRLGWVLAGVCISGIASAVGYTASRDRGPIEYAGWFLTASDFAAVALPLALAYAILRHRVIDLGFAINRTVVYAIITLGLVIVVSFIDWLSGRFLLGGRFSLALEAVVTVAFGVALNWIHQRVDKLVDRIFFRERHQAERRLEERIHALDFAKQSTTVDDTLVSEAATILRLTSAAVFRRDSSGGYLCAAERGWKIPSTSIQEDDLLVRTLLAKEQTIVLEDSGIFDARFPSGDARPDIAIPLAIRHELRGFVLYGHRVGDAALDPEERRLLQALARQAAIAYDAIEADAYRSEALSLRALGAM